MLINLFMRVLDLQRIRAEKKISQVKVAELTGYPQGFVSVIERGKASAPQAFIDKVASVLAVENIEDYVSVAANPNLKKKMAKRAEKTEEKQPVTADEVGKASAASQEQSIVSDFLELLKKKEEKIEMLEAEIEELKQELAVYLQATSK